MTADLGHDTVTLDLAAAARRLAPQIIAARDEAERLRQIPQALADALAGAGLYQMYLPRSLGGPELPPMTVFEAIEELSKADGSVGWCVMNSNVPSLIAGWLAPEAARLIPRRAAGSPGSGIVAAARARLAGGRRLSPQGAMEFRQRFA